MLIFFFGMGFDIKRKSHVKYEQLLFSFALQCFFFKKHVVTKTYGNSDEWPLKIISTKFFTFFLRFNTLECLLYSWMFSAFILKKISSFQKSHKNTFYCWRWNRNTRKIGMLLQNSLDKYANVQLAWNFSYVEF